jgi:hypothetical protein
MSHIIYAAKFEQTIIHQHVLLRRESQPHILYNWKVSRIDKTSVTIIKVYYRICTVRHIRIEIIHGSQNVF